MNHMKQPNPLTTSCLKSLLKAVSSLYIYRCYIIAHNYIYILNYVYRLPIGYMHTTLFYVIQFVYSELPVWLSGSGVRHTSSRTRIRASSGPLINFIKWVLTYYLEVILYNCL